MLNPLTWLSRKRFPYEPLIRVQISKSRLIHNLKAFFESNPYEFIAPVIKSNAYGHGLLEIARILDQAAVSNPLFQNRLPFLAIDSYFEAVALTAQGIKTPLLIIGYTSPEIITTSRTSRIVYSISNLDILKKISQTRRAVRIHLKFDTGMHRQGLEPNEIEEALNIIMSNSKIILEGVFSHLSDSANPDDSYTRRQIRIWNDLVRKVKEKIPSVSYYHIAATDGHWQTFLSQKENRDKIEANLTRLGLGLYGLATFKNQSAQIGVKERVAFTNNLNLKPVLEMSTIITGLRRLPAGESVGYDRTYTTKKETLLATIPVGYYEGLDRRLSNKGFVTVSNVNCPLAGLISMNISSLDVSAVQDPRLGDKVTVISREPDDPNSIACISTLCSSVPYEIVVHIPAHLKRVVVE